MKFRNLLLVSVFLISCQNENQNELIPYLTSPSISTFDKGLALHISQEQFTTMIDKEMSFPLFVYSPGCSSCDLLGDYLSAYIKQTNIVFPFLFLDEYQNKSAFSLQESAFLFYHNGLLIHSKTSFEDIGSFKELKNYFASHLTDSSISLYNTIEYKDDYSYPYFSLSYTLSSTFSFAMEEKSLFIKSFSSYKDIVPSLKKDNIKNIIFDKDDFVPGSFFEKEFHITDFDHDAFLYENGVMKNFTVKLKE